MTASAIKVRGPEADGHGGIIFILGGPDDIECPKFHRRKMSQHLGDRIEVEFVIPAESQKAPKMIRAERFPQA
jgi:hypothetical protein